MLRKSKILTIILCVFFTIVLTLIILFPQKSIIGAKNGIEISINTLIPSLFPFTFLSIFLSTSGLCEKIFYYPSLILSKMFKKDISYFTLFFVSILGGYISAAKCVSQYYQKGIISKKSAETLICCYTNAGPSFLISAIGVGMFFSISLGIILYISSIISSLTMFFIYYNKIDNNTNKISVSKKTYPESFVKSVKSTCSTISIICSCVILFSVILSFYPQKMCGVLVGIFEVTSGAILLSSEISFKSIATVSFITGFSGLCIILQIFSISAEADLSTKKFLFSRFIYAPLMTFYTIILINVIPITSSQTFTSNFSTVSGQKSISIISSLLLLACCILFPIFLSREKNDKI